MGKNRRERSWNLCCLDSGQLSQNPLSLLEDRELPSPNSFLPPVVEFPELRIWFKEKKKSLRQNCGDQMSRQGFALVAQLCLALFDPMVCSSSGSSVHGILQAKILQGVAMPFSRESS